MADSKQQSLHGEVQLSEHFSLREARCRCGCGIEKQYIPQLTAQAERLELLRQALNDNPDLAKFKPAGGEITLIVLSWIRCPAHNREDGGADESRHLPQFCDATDITCPELPEHIVFEKAKQFFRRSIYYRGRHFVHVDHKPGPSAHWVKAPSPTVEPERA